MDWTWGSSRPHRWSRYSEGTVWRRRYEFGLQPAKSKREKKPIAFKTVRRENADLAKVKNKLFRRKRRTSDYLCKKSMVVNVRLSRLNVRRKPKIVLSKLVPGKSVTDSIEGFEDASTNIINCVKGSQWRSSVLEVDKVADQVLEGRRFRCVSGFNWRMKRWAVQLKGAALVQVLANLQTCNVYAMNANQELQEVKFEQKGSALEFAPQVSVQSSTKDANQPDTPTNGKLLHHNLWEKDKLEAEGTAADSAGKQSPQATGKSNFSSLTCSHSCFRNDAILLQKRYEGIA